MNALLTNLSTRHRILILAVAVLAAGGLYSLVHFRKEADFKPLFTRLPAEDAAGIVQKLKESGVDFRLPDEGGSVLVPSSRLSELRLTMAAAGLPKAGRIGFELFDKVNLGATEFTEHVNYRRALEGELERTVTALSEVEQARVHLTFPKESVFLEAQQPAKASVVVKLWPGKKLAPQNVIAINHLMASAVEGLSPDSVSVLDMNGNLLGKPKATGGIDGPEPSAATLDYRHQIEADLLAKINGTLAPLLGAEKFRAGVSVECDFAGGELSEEVFDPARSVMVSSQRTEDTTGSASSAGVPGTASTLPRPASKPGAGSNRTARTTENTTYQSSRTVKKTRLPAGAIRRMSLAVLVDQDVTWEKAASGMKRVLSPPTPEKLKAIRGLIAGITGMNEERGDQLVIETLPFENTLALEAPMGSTPATDAKPGPGGITLPVKVTMQQMLMAGGALVLLIGGAAVFMLRRRKGKKGSTAGAPGELAGAAGAARAGLPGGSAEIRIESQLAERDALQQKMDDQALSSLKLTPVITKKAEIFAKHLREKIVKEPEINVQILRSWIREDEN